MGIVCPHVNDANSVHGGCERGEDGDNSEYPKDRGNNFGMGECVAVFHGRLETSNLGLARVCKDSYLGGSFKVWYVEGDGWDAADLLSTDRYTGPSCDGYTCI